MTIKMTQLQLDTLLVWQDLLGGEGVRGPREDQEDGGGGEAGQQRGRQIPAAGGGLQRQVCLRPQRGRDVRGGRTRTWEPQGSRRSKEHVRARGRLLQHAKARDHLRHENKSTVRARDTLQDRYRNITKRQTNFQTLRT